MLTTPTVSYMIPPVLFPTRIVLMPPDVLFNIALAQRLESESFQQPIQLPVAGQDIIDRLPENPRPGDATGNFWIPLLHPFGKAKARA